MSITLQHPVSPEGALIARLGARPGIEFQLVGEGTDDLCRIVRFTAPDGAALDLVGETLCDVEKGHFYFDLDFADPEDPLLRQHGIGRDEQPTLANALAWRHRRLLVAALEEARPRIVEVASQASAR